jgi:lipoprotein-releasing system permease protein
MTGRMYRRFIAHKYLFSRIVTFAALVAVAASVALLIVIVSVMEGFRSELQDRIRGTSSDLKVESTRYIGLKDPDRVAEILEQVPGVRATAPFVETLVLFRDQGRLIRGRPAEHRLLRVVDLERELKMGKLAEYVRAVNIPFLPTDPAKLLSQEWLEHLWALTREVGPFRPERKPGPLPPPVLLGSEAYTARARSPILPGDVVELTAYSPQTQLPCKREFIVSGYFKTGLYEIDSQGILMEREVAKDFLNLVGADGRESQSGVRIAVDPDLKTAEGLARVKERVEEAIDVAGIPFARVTTWRDEKATLLEAVHVEKSIMSLILGVIIIFGGLMVFIILTVLVVEKTRDLGVLQSLGATPNRIASIFFRIGLALCVTGTIIGTIYGVAFALCVNTIQRWITLVTGWILFNPKVYYLDSIPVRFQPWDLALIIVPTVLVSLLAARIPAARASRKDPVVALRYE